MRAMLPAGFMLAPGTTDSFDFKIVICTGQGPQTSADGDGGTQDSSHQKTSHDQCPFAASALLGVVAEVAALAATVQYADVTYALAREQFARTPRPGAASARGPPALA